MRIRHDVELINYNTFALPARAEMLVDIHHPEDVPILLKQNKKISKWILGGGSNLILTQDLSGIGFWLRNLGIETVFEDNESIYWQVSAGENWHKLVQSSLSKGYSGLENLSLIPGTVGAAPIQNIGAYGVELKSVFVECDAIDLLTGQKNTFTREDCRFDYRDSIFKQTIDAQWLITQVTIKLNKQPHLITQYGELKAWADQFSAEGKCLTPAALGNRVCEIRQSKLPDPKKLPNAGSFFKNPLINEKQLQKLKEKWPNIIFHPAGEQLFKVAAGWLLEQLGWKGYRSGALGFHAQQALVMVNYGGATGTEVLTLAQQVQDQVEQETGIRLLIEPKIV